MKVFKTGVLNTVTVSLNVYFIRLVSIMCSGHPTRLATISVHVFDVIVAITLIEMNS